MAPFAKKATTDEQRLRGMPTFVPGQRRSKRADAKPKRRPAMRSSFRFQFFQRPESAAVSESTSHDSTSKSKWRSRHSIATRTKRSASIVRRSELDAFRSACAFRGVPICHVSLATRFRTQNRARTVVLTRHTRARLDVAHAPLSLVLRDQARARQVRRRDSSFRPPPRLLQPPRPLSRVARETDRNIPYPSPNAARATRGRRPRPPRPLGTRSALRTARMSLSRSL